MKPARLQLEKQLDAGGGGVRLFLFFGPDEGGAHALGRRLVRALGGDAERVALDGVALKADPSRLADEAASLSLFGSPRYIWLTLGNEDVTRAVDTLLDAPTAGHPVLAFAPGLKATSPLVKRLQDHPLTSIQGCYPLGDREMAELANGLAREQGVRIDSTVARKLVSLSGGERDILASEIEKLALYLNASPTQPGEADLSAIDAISADAGEPDLSVLTDMVFGGRPEAAAAQLAALAAEGIDGIGLIRALNRRLYTLLRLRAAIADGERVETVTAGLFFKERDSVKAQLGRWTPDRLARAADRLLATEKAIKAPGSPGPVLADAELIAITRAARR